MSEEVTDEAVVTLSDDALGVVRDVLAEEDDPESLGLWLEVTGMDGADFAYDMYFSGMGDVVPEDRVQRDNGLPVVIPAGSVAKLQGARLDVEDGGLVLVNPNRPTFDATDTESVGDLSGPVEEDTVFLRMGGGCQGCGMASATLGQGVEVAIKENVPEITRVVDVTDHAGGTNPYYEQAKK